MLAHLERLSTYHQSCGYCRFFTGSGSESTTKSSGGAAKT